MGHFLNATGQRFCRVAQVAGPLVLTLCLSSPCQAALYEFDLPELRGTLNRIVDVDLDVTFSEIDSVWLELTGHQGIAGFETDRLPAESYSASGGFASITSPFLLPPPVIEFCPPAPRWLYASIHDVVGNQTPDADRLMQYPYVGERTITLYTAARLPLASSDFSVMLSFRDDGGTISEIVFDLLGDGAATFSLFTDSAFPPEPFIGPLPWSIETGFQPLALNSPPVVVWPGPGPFVRLPALSIDSARLYVAGTASLRTPEPTSWRVLMAGIAVGLPVFRQRYRRLRLSGAAAPDRL